MEEAEYRVEAWIIEDSGPDYLMNLRQNFLKKYQEENEEVKSFGWTKP